MTFPMSPGRCPECGALCNEAHLADCPKAPVDHQGDTMTRKPERATSASAECILDECRFVDSTTGEYGYAVACVASHGCGFWREMFRIEVAG